MKLTVLEKKKDKLKIGIDGEDYTLLNLLRENSWKKGAKQASYMIHHPYLSKPEITVSGPNPKKILANAAQVIIDDSKAFQSGFKKKS
jgi:DNA-directed RNA polymerase subunit L